jgi:hypothetical protein
MLKCLIIGFSYAEDSYIEDDIRVNLPGIIVDLYLAYNKAKSINAAEICIITDITNNVQTELLADAIHECTVKSDILNFIDIIKNDRVYHNYIGKEDFINKINNFGYNADYYLIYYTGHYNNGIILPTHNKDICYPDSSDKSYINGNQFRNIVISNGNQDCKYLFIMDCCNFDGFGLAYMMYQEASRRYTLNTTSIKRFYTTKEITCISSSSYNFKSIATKKGSLFSKIFFRSANGKYRDLILLCYHINEELKRIQKHKITVYVSNPFLTLLPRWFADGVKVIIDTNPNFITLE